MQVNNDRNHRLVLLTLVFSLALNYPLASVFDQQRLRFGVPLLYGYCFVLWLGLIVLTAWTLRKR